MRINSIRGIVAVWSAFLASGTWILPLGTLLLSPVRGASAQVSDETHEQVFMAIQLEFEQMIVDGELDTPVYFSDEFDLNDDGVGEQIVVDPGAFHESDGQIIVVDGATGLTRAQLQSPAGEFIFGEMVGVVSDIDFVH